MSAAEPRAVAERVARTAYGRLIALLAAPTGDLAGAEDALAGAFEQALRSWPEAGVPQNPEGWLLTVARNRQRDVWKSAAHRMSAPLEAVNEAAGAAAGPPAALDPDAITDHRLRLLFVCAHPAIDPAVRTPLMLQAVLGLDAARIAAAFAVPAATMAQRLVRAKRKIKEARIPFAEPEPAARDERLPAVLEAVYGCYAIAGEGDLAGEAQYLAVTLAALLGTDAEAWGLAALITFARSREGARGDEYVPIEEQDPRLWDEHLIDEGGTYLRHASARGGEPGRFQIEAAIQAVHCGRARAGWTDWDALQTLYAALVLTMPTLGGQVALAAVTGRADGEQAGLDMLAPLAGRATDFQPYHATRAALLAGAGHTAEAAEAYRRAIALTLDASVHRYLSGRLGAIEEVYSRVT